MRSFCELLQLHKALEELFLEHQRALIRFDFRDALLRLEEYEAGLLAHMRDEEELLIPLYHERAGRIQGGAVELFLGEHRKMRQFIDRFKERIPPLAEASDVEREVIELISEQATFKHLSEHHDSREEVILYPALDRIISEEERDWLARELTFPLPPAAPAPRAR